MEGKSRDKGKAEVVCYKCKQKGHYASKFKNKKLKDVAYYEKILHLDRLRTIQIEDGSSKAKDKALVVKQEDEGFNWNNYIPKTESLAMLAEIIKELEQIVEEVVEDVDDEIFGEFFFFDETSDDYNSQSHEMLHNAFKSIMIIILHLMICYIMHSNPS
ncbi:putative transcription factor interactor and regulator CCHC(Zn) family [Helianthus anomalus]